MEFSFIDERNAYATGITAEDISTALAYRVLPNSGNPQILD